MTDSKEQWTGVLGDNAGNYYTTASPTEQERFRIWIQGLLREQEITVDFHKANGDFRSMKCTLNEDLGAKYSKQNATERTRSPNPEVCVVWDTSQAAWRSFRWDRVKRIQFDIG